MYIAGMVIHTIFAHLIPGNYGGGLFSFKSVLQPNLLRLLPSSSSTWSTAPPLIHHRMTACVCGRVAAPQIAAARRALAFRSLLNLPLLSTVSHALVRAGPCERSEVCSQGRRGDLCRCPHRPATMGYFRPTGPGSLSILSLLPSVCLSSSHFSSLTP